MSAFIFFNDKLTDIFNIKPLNNSENVGKALEDAKILLKRTGYDQIKQFIEYKNGDDSENSYVPFAQGMSDTISVTVYKDSTLIARNNEMSRDLADLRAKLNSKDMELSQITSEIEHLRSKVESGSDSAHLAWKKNTVKMFEAMDSKKAALIIVGYEDELARELIYGMKKKKAAEILSLIKSEKALTLTRVE
jgi:flagellar motility protein MotE (MotC chaperone)